MSDKTKPTTPSNATTDETQPTGDDSTTPQPGADNTPEGDEEEEGEESEGTKLTFTSKALKERNDRIARQEQRKLLATLGVNNLDEAKEAIKRKKELEDEKLSTEERLQKERDEAVKRAEAAERAANKAKKEAAEKEAEIFLSTAAKNAGVTDDAKELVQAKLEKHIADNFSDDDDITEEALAPFFKKLKSDKKLWFEAKETPASTGAKEKTSPAAPVGTTPPPKPYAEMTVAERNEYKRAKGLRV